MFTSIIICILFVLSIQVLPVALGIEPGRNPGKSFWFGLILLLGQVLFLWFGLILGNRFMHLLEGFKGVVLFIGFFLIGIRMMMDTFKVRKGERTFTIDTSLQIFLASSAQGINTFLAGLMFTLFEADAQWLSVVLIAGTTAATAVGMFLKPTKQTLAFSSFFYAFGGLIMLVSSIYLGFIYE